MAIRLLPADVVTACRTQADEWMQRKGAKPRSKWGMVLVVSVWLVVARAFWQRSA